MRCALVIPTRNAGAHLDRLLPALAAQRRQPDSILVVDSRSSDDTVERFRAFGARVEVIEPASFNHGGTRRWASQQVEADALIYLTQDAIPASPDSFANLLDELYAEADIGVAYGRQLPHPGAGLLGAQARCFNYPPESRSKRLADASELGIKTCFSSDSFSAYRSDALAAVGGFPEDVIGSEDAYVAAPAAGRLRGALRGQRRGLPFPRLPLAGRVPPLFRHRRVLRPRALDTCCLRRRGWRGQALCPRRDTGLACRRCPVSRT